MASRNDIGPADGTPTVLFAIEPRSYREMIRSAVGHLRPRLLVVAVEPSGLRREIESLEPVLVVADLPDTFSRDGRPYWVHFNPYVSLKAEARLGNEYRELEEVELEDILEMVDQAVTQIVGRSYVSGTR